MKGSRALPALLFFYCGVAAADYLVECTAGCIRPPGEERTPNLLLFDDPQQEIEITWQSAVQPAADEQHQLRAGNPEVQDTLPDLGSLTFARAGDAWQASRRFRTDQLGHGTFIAAIVSTRGSKSRIADWRAFRVLRLSEAESQRQDASVPGGHSIDLVPSRLQVSSGHGQLPHHTGGVEQVWWNIPASRRGGEVDIDGEHTGVAGVGVTHSPVWESRGDDWQQQIREMLPKIKNHFVDFGDPEFDELEYRESESREAELRGVADKVLIKHYYSAITIFTNATSAIHRAQDVGQGGNRRYFSHETTANLRQGVHPKLWASYSRHEYSADPQLLQLIAQGVRDRGVPGLAHVQQDDGDGGSALYSVGFRTRVAPWDVPDDDREFVPGFVHLDVVAVRTGYGDIETQTNANARGLCKLITCRDGTKIDLSKPPRGYEVAAPLIYTGGRSGTLLMLEGKQYTAQREDLPANAIKLPASTEFAVAAHMRAGALIRKGGLFSNQVSDLVPINSYVQFVVKYTVAMLPRTEMIVSDEAILPKANEFDTTTVVVPKRNLWQWLRDTIGFPGLMIFAAIALIVLAIFVPPVAGVLRAILRFFQALIERLTSIVRRA